VTETLAERTLSLPFYRDLGDDNVGRVMAALAEALKAQSTEGAAS
jgi:dTDP-4-amino-4,6-dideoxygalactose transaminase